MPSKMIVKNKIPNTAAKAAFLLCLVAGFSLGAAAQTSTAKATCALLGADAIPGGTVATYCLKGCHATSWQVSCGVITAQTDTTITVSLNMATCSNVAVTAISAAGPAASKTIIIQAAPALNGGAITTANQTVTKDSLVQPITATAATNGLCNGVYTYQWYQSPDSVHFTAIPGAVGRAYQPGPLDSTMYFKRQSKCGTVTGFTGNTIVIHVRPRLKADSLTPGVQMLNYQSTPVPISLSPVTGGSGNYTYQWQSSPAGAKRAWQPVSGATAAAYLPTKMDSTTYFRVLIRSKGDSTYSPEAVIGVFPPLLGGSVSPASQTLNSGDFSQLLSLDSCSGGTGAYTYQWFSSLDGANWSPLQGVATAAYGPGEIAVTTYYRVAVISNGVTAMSAPAKVTVNVSTSTH